MRDKLLGVIFLGIVVGIAPSFAALAVPPRPSKEPFPKRQPRRVPLPDRQPQEKRRPSPERRVPAPEPEKRRLPRPRPARALTELAIGSAIDSKRLVSALSPPSAVHVSGSTYAMAYCESGGHGSIATFSISASGAIGNVIDNHEFETSACLRPSMTHVGGEFFAFVYEGMCGNACDVPTNVQGVVAKTVTIAADGAIGSIVEDKVIDGYTKYSPTILHGTGSTFIVTMQHPQYPAPLGQVLGLVISPTTGRISNSPQARSFGTYALSIDPILLGGDVYAAAYRGGSGSNSYKDEGRILTFTVNDQGVVAAPGSFAIDTGQWSSRGLDPDIVHVGGNVYAIAYAGGATLQGYLTTLTIEPSGDIGATIDTKQIESAQTTEPDILAVGGSDYVVAYARRKDDDTFGGRLKAINITSTGAISLPNITRDFDDIMTIRAAFRVSGSTHALVYRTAAGDGWLRSLPISRKRIRVRRQP